jgi:hypothetical protein
MQQQNLDAIKVLGKAKASIATATTTALDFGAPDDIDLRSTNWQAGCRLLVILRSTTAGTTDTTGWTIQDAPDNAGSIGTPAAAVTNVVGGDTLAGGTGDRYSIVEVTPQADRPWLRINTTRASGTTDTTVVSAIVLGLPFAI